MINQFLDWAQAQPNVWIVSNEQLLSWVRDPVPISQLNNSPALKCSSPVLDDNIKICNGMAGHEDGLLERCPFSDFPFFTCSSTRVVLPLASSSSRSADSCISIFSQATDAQSLLLPSLIPTLHRIPALRLDIDVSLSFSLDLETRFRLRSLISFPLSPVPSNCSTAFWDPIGNTCICQSGDCSFTDISRPIGANGANLTGGGTNVDVDTATGSASATSTAHHYTPFNHAGQSTTVSQPLLLSLLLVCVAITFSGSAFVFSPPSSFP